MLGIIVCTHSSLAKGLLESVEMIAGKQSDFHVISLQEGDDLSTLSEVVKQTSEYYTKNNIEFVVLVDLFGATPFNASAIAFAKQNVNIITGVNLPILLELVTTREHCEDCRTLLENVIFTGKESIKIMNMEEMFQ